MKMYHRYQSLAVEAAAAAVVVGVFVVVGAAEAAGVLHRVGEWYHQVYSVGWADTEVMLAD